MKQIHIKVSDEEFKHIKQVCYVLNCTYKQLLLNALNPNKTKTLKPLSEKDQQVYEDIRDMCHDLARLGNALMMKGYDVQLSKDITDIKNQIKERLLSRW